MVCASPNATGSSTVMMTIGIVRVSTAWPLAARAQQQPVRSLIGILSPLSAASAGRNIAAFRSGLRDLGYLEGRNATPPGFSPLRMRDSNTSPASGDELPPQ